MPGPDLPSAGGPGTREWVLVGLLGLAVGVLFGLSFGRGNQVTYLLGGLARIDPSNFQGDWLATRTRIFYDSFSFLVRTLGEGGALPWVLAGLNIASIAVGFVAIHFISRSLNRKAASLTAAVILASLVLAGKTLTVAVTYVFSDEFQPSTPATVAFLGMMAALVRGRTFLAGVLLALSGLLHTNFLLAGLTAVGIYHVARHRAVRIGPLLRLMGPALVVLALRMPMLLGMSGSADAAAAREIFLTIRAPFHYVPGTFLLSFVPFLGWHVVALGCYRLLDDVDPAVMRRLTALHAAFFGIVVVATILTTVVWIPVVSQLFFWRLAPFSVLICHVLVAAVAARTFGTHASRRAADRPWLDLGLVALGALMVVRWEIRQRGVVTFGTPYYAILFALLALAAWPVLSPPRGRGLRNAVAGVLLLLGVAVQWPRFRADSNLLGSAPEPPSAGVTEFAASTPPGTRFAVPPDLRSFRLLSRRAVVVDWVSLPILPDEVVEWHRRVGAVSGVDSVTSLSQALEGYRGMTNERVDSLYREFGIDYVVLERGAPAVGDTAYSDSAYVVLEVGPDSGAADGPGSGGGPSPVPEGGSAP